ncbi:hypothetical protein XU18_2458 [Perkinsela sp. CCAP 1560/4]|nr:hypothetical protein XU18_2458 [Perkinsela sp. CCAP 1560/4]|eukprot:KNH06750.1 hypothetical protein XU18_2458 [Perkinsela sp. CCAP 1560/4]
MPITKPYESDFPCNPTNVTESTKMYEINADGVLEKNTNSESRRASLRCTTGEDEPRKTTKSLDYITRPLFKETSISETVPFFVRWYILAVISPGWYTNENGETFYVSHNLFPFILSGFLVAISLALLLVVLPSLPLHGWNIHFLF